MAKNEMLDKGLEWLSRTIAVMIVMAGPGLIGSFIDRRFGMRLWTPIGLVVGFVLGTGLLLILARKLTPPARGKPIPFEDAEEEPEEDQDPIDRSPQ